MEHSNSQYEAMTSLAKAALHLLRNLLTVDELVIRKRFQVVSGIFKLLDQSLLFAKNSLSTEETASEVKACNEIFQAALQSLHDSLEKHCRWDLLRLSANRRNEELQVILQSCLTDRLNLDCLTEGGGRNDVGAQGRRDGWKNGSRDNETSGSVITHCKLRIIL